MKIVIAFLMAVLASVSGFSQEERPVNPVRILGGPAYHPL